MNVKLLRKVAKHILAEPRRLFMEGIQYKDEPGTMVDLDYIPRKIPSCGTVACIAGWTCILANSSVVSLERAEKLLEINSNQSTDLFNADWWPEQFERQWISAKTVKRRAQIAADRISHFIKTGE